MNDAQHKNTLPLRWVLQFIYCTYAECCYAEYRCAECCSAGYHILLSVLGPRKEHLTLIFGYVEADQWMANTLAYFSRERR